MDLHLSGLLGSFFGSGHGIGGSAAMAALERCVLSDVFLSFVFCNQS